MVEYIAYQSGKRADKYRPKLENISLNTQTDLKPKLGPKIKLDVKKIMRILLVYG